MHYSYLIITQVIILQQITISQLENDNEILKGKVEETEDDLKNLRQNLQQLKNIDMASLESKLSTTSTNAQEEKRQLKKDMKELVNINDRLRVKLKDMTAAHESLQVEKRDVELCLEEEKKTSASHLKDLEIELKRVEEEVIDLNEKLMNNKELSSKYSQENVELHSKVDELIKITEAQKTLTGPELKNLREEVLALTKENSALKIEKLEFETDKEENKELLSNLAELRQRNKNLQDELHTQNMTNSQLQNELIQKRSEISELEMKLRTPQQDNKQLDNLHSNLEELRRAKFSLEKQLKDLLKSTNKIKDKLAT